MAPVSPALSNPLVSYQNKTLVGVLGLGSRVWRHIHICHIFKNHMYPSVVQYEKLESSSLNAYMECID